MTSKDFAPGLMLKANVTRSERVSPAAVLRHSVRDAIAVCETLLDDRLISSIEAILDAIVSSLSAGGKVLLCGNGGSAADAQHLAAELVGRFHLDRHPLPAIALADNIAVVTAISNDYAYEDVFARGVHGLGRPGDVLIGLSTSGSSPSVVAALRAADEIGLVTVAFVGRPDCAMTEIAMHALCVAGPTTARIQEGHMLVGHTIFELVERELCVS